MSRVGLIWYHYLHYAATPVTPEKTLRVIVADDQEIALVGSVMTLRRFQDLEVIGECRDGAEVIRLSLQLQPDVILMDIVMPELDGIEATRIIKESNPLMRIVMFTSYSRDEDIFAAFASGADGYCTKDADANQMYNAIRSTAAGAAWLDPVIAQRILHATLQAKRAPFKQKTATDLSPREMDVLKLLVEGLSNQEIGSRLYVTSETVKTHVRHIMEKLRVSDRTQAAVKALREGLL